MNLTVHLDNNNANTILEVRNVTLGEKQRNNMSDKKLKKDQKEHIGRAITAFLNSRGGVVKIGIENESYSYQEDGIGLDLEACFRDIVPFVSKSLDFMQQEKNFLISVKPWNINSIIPIATVESNLYKRDGTSTNMMKNIDALEFLKEKKNLGGCIITKKPSMMTHYKVQGERDIEAAADDFFSRNQLKYGEKLTFTESTHVEMKCFKTEKSFQRIKEILPLNVSAFANTDGGYLFIGIDDDKQVTGFEIGSIESIQTEIKNTIEKLPVCHFCKDMKKIEYTCNFLKVCDDELNRYVLALRIEKFCCAVFAKDPHSWYVEDNTNTVKQFSAEKWGNQMVNGKN